MFMLNTAWIFNCSYNFGLLLYVQVNSYGHVMSPKHTFFLNKLEQAVNKYFVHILSLVTDNNPSWMIHRIGLFDLILYDPSAIFQLNRDGSSWVEPVLS